MNAASISNFDVMVEESGWPSRGEIEAQSLRIGYRDGPDVLHGVSFKINAGEKVGIAGRTGSGKTTLMLALLRVVEARAGRLLVDGVGHLAKGACACTIHPTDATQTNNIQADISTMGLHLLRARIGIVPQEPTLFIGTLRFNLDPFKAHTDGEIYDALEKVHMKDFATGKAEKLDFAVEQNGENVSLGERQLLCMARALLRRTPVLLFDEASASLDDASDELLQKMLRTAFKTCTTLTIAHRLETIADADRVMIFDKGNLAEFDPPWRLLQIAEEEELGGAGEGNGDGKGDGKGEARSPRKERIFHSMVSRLDPVVKNRVYEMSKRAWDARVEQERV